MIHLNYPILIPRVVLIRSTLLPNHGIIISNTDTDVVIQLVCRDKPFADVNTGDVIDIGTVKVYSEVSIHRFLTHFSAYTEIDSTPVGLCNTLKNSLIGLVLRTDAETDELFGDYFNMFYEKHDKHFNVLLEYLEKNKHVLFTEETLAVN